VLLLVKAGASAAGRSSTIVTDRQTVADLTADTFVQAITSFATCVSFPSAPSGAGGAGSVSP
jgi:hypothetical protein